MIVWKTVFSTLLQIPEYCIVTDKVNSKLFSFVTYPYYHIFMSSIILVILISSAIWNKQNLTFYWRIQNLFLTRIFTYQLKLTFHFCLSISMGAMMLNISFFFSFMAVMCWRMKNHLIQLYLVILFISVKECKLAISILNERLKLKYGSV